MIPLVDNPHITVRINQIGGVEGITTNISPDVQVNVCYTEKNFNETKQGDSYAGKVEVVPTEVVIPANVAG